LAPVSTIVNLAQALKFSEPLPAAMLEAQFLSPQTVV